MWTNAEISGSLTQWLNHEHERLRRDNGHARNEMVTICIQSSHAHPWNIVCEQVRIHELQLFSPTFFFVHYSSSPSPSQSQHFAWNHARTFATSLKFALMAKPRRTEQGKMHPLDRRKHSHTHAASRWAAIVCLLSQWPHTKLELCFAQKQPSLVSHRRLKMFKRNHIRCQHTMRCTRPSRERVAHRKRTEWIHQACLQKLEARSDVVLAQLPMIWFLTTEKRKPIWFVSFLFRRWQRGMEWNEGEKRNINCILPFLDRKKRVDFGCWWLADCVQRTSFMHPCHMPLPNTWCTMKRIVSAIVFCSPLVFLSLVFRVGFGFYRQPPTLRLVSRDPNWVLSHIARQHANLMTF